MVAIAPVNEKRNQIAQRLHQYPTAYASQPSVRRVVVVPGEHDTEDGSYMKNIAGRRLRPSIHCGAISYVNNVNV